MLTPPMGECPCAGTDSFSPVSPPTHTQTGELCACAAFPWGQQGRPELQQPDSLPGVQGQGMKCRLGVLVLGILDSGGPLRWGRGGTYSCSLQHLLDRVPWCGSRGGQRMVLRLGWAAPCSGDTMVMGSFFGWPSGWLQHGQTESQSGLGFGVHHR